ncbi:MULTISPECIES: hypothetical protein [unclassified Mesorhizobium]|uniref:hypothetical protein n=1 Tax=unclassified Mesorhizobium TaxID=325217 RepID=UPI001091B465|nr:MULTISPECIES: hypothetical protein [unclassified Mesorhizobium]TGP85615.1 hypothetical protein EN861_33090 [Mesorhizobium sp. M8A.F.Ca.ET.218.01.1.1]TGT14766.1 hypothetical protein EN856_32630 [Mesorhizobium sp. M8A.F.Ca.ET.213.01.1.1]
MAWLVAYAGGNRHRLSVLWPIFLLSVRCGLRHLHQRFSRKLRFLYLGAEPEVGRRGNPLWGKSQNRLRLPSVVALLAFYLLVPRAFAAETAEDVYKLPCTEPDLSAEPGHLTKEAERRRLIDPAHPVAVNLGLLKFEIPWAYIYPRPFSTHLNCNPNRKSVGIIFWIPDLKAPERDLWGIPEFHPSETDRPNPGPDDSVIRVTGIQYYGQGYPLKESNADQRIDKLLRLYQDDGLTIIDQDGLSKMQTKYTTRDNDQYYFRNDKDSLLLSCMPTYCQAYLDLKDMNLTAQFAIRREVFRKYQQASRGIRTLLMRWMPEKN